LGARRSVEGIGKLLQSEQSRGECETNNLTAQEYAEPSKPERD